MKAQIIFIWNWGFKKNNKHFDPHNKVMRVGNCPDFMFRKSFFCPHQFMLSNVTRGVVGRESKNEGPSPTISILLGIS